MFVVDKVVEEDRRTVLLVNELELKTLLDKSDRMTQALVPP